MDLHFTFAEAFRLQGFITVRQLKRALGISHQAAWKRIRRMVDAGELLVESSGKGTRYIPGPGAPSDLGGAIGTELDEVFWKSLVERSPDLTYVGVYHAARATHRKQDAAALLRDVPFAGFVILDFERVESIGDAFAREAFCGQHAGSGTQILAINASPAIRRTIERARRRQIIKWARAPD